MKSHSKARAVADARELSGLEHRYANEIKGRLVCFDRLVIFGTMRRLHNPDTLHYLLAEAGLGAFDLKQYCLPLTQDIRANAQRLAAEHGISIRFIADHKTRKEQIVADIIAQRGSHPGLVAVLSAMENCRTFAPRRAGGNHRRDWLKSAAGHCLHYYFYFMDEHLGLLHVRVPAWVPFRLQFCLNGHHWLACRMRQAGISFTQEDNAFSAIGDWTAAQALSQQVPVRQLESILQRYANLCCPVARRFGRYYLSVAEAELSLDIAFASAKALAPVCEQLCRQSMLSTRLDQMAGYLGKKFSAEAQATAKFRTVSETVWCVRHYLCGQSLKLYNKGSVLRLENTSTDISFYRHYREVIRGGDRREGKSLPLKKQLISLPDLYKLMGAGCRRYLEHLSTLEDPSIGRHNLDRITRSKRDGKERSWRGINFFLATDLRLIQALMRGEGQLSGWTHRRLRKILGHRFNSGQISRMLRRLREHGILKRIRGTFTYYLTALGKSVLMAGLKIRQHLIIPSLQTS